MPSGINRITGNYQIRAGETTGKASGLAFLDEPLHFAMVQLGAELGDFLQDANFARGAKVAQPSGSHGVTNLRRLEFGLGADRDEFFALVGVCHGDNGDLAVLAVMREGPASASSTAVRLTISPLTLAKRLARPRIQR